MENYKLFHVNLEAFPSNETAKEMLNMVTKDWYEKSYVGKWIFQIMGKQMENAKELYDELRLQIFPETTTWGILYHEQKYGIIPNPLLSLEERKAAVLQKRKSQVAMNPARLEESLFQIFKRKASVEEDVKPYTILIVIEDGMNHLVLNELDDYIRMVKPSHISYLFEFERSEKIGIKGDCIAYEVPYVLCGSFLSGEGERIPLGGI